MSANKILLKDFTIVTMNERRDVLEHAHLVVEDGKIGRSVKQITVAGNFFQLLKDIVETGSDFEFAHGGSASPSVWVKALSVAGE